MMVNRVISDNGLVVTDTGVDIDIRVPWYRALPLSTVGVTEVAVDGKEVDLTSLTFEVNGKTYKLKELSKQFTEWWYVLDSAYLHVPGLTIERGSTHQVKVTVSIRPPYIPGFYRLTECTKKLRAH
jgi:Domain of unknown function (DUF6379)